MILRMESHPVPQNVTSFEFHLVGDMTIKQFIYLAVGLAIAYILFIAIGTKFPIIAWPLILFFGLTGVAFAFVPISERPLDHWVGAFMTAIMRPTQLKWASGDKRIQTPPVNRLGLYLASLNQPATPQAVTPKVAMAPILKATPSSNPPASKPPEKLPSSDELAKTVELAKKAQGVQSEIVASEKELERIKSSAVAPGVDPKNYEPNLQKVLSNLQELTKQASEVSHEMAELNKAPAKTATLPRVVVVAPQRSAPINLSLTSTPNVINGVVTDATGNYLDGVIVVTHDKQGLPVRALKTNKLGQFVAATPLPSGTYTITVEKESLAFDTLQIDLEGRVMPPLLIQAKKGAV